MSYTSPPSTKGQPSSPTDGSTPQTSVYSPQLVRDSNDGQSSDGAAGNQSVNNGNANGHGHSHGNGNANGNGTGNANANSGTGNNHSHQIEVPDQDVEWSNDADPDEPGYISRYLTITLNKDYSAPGSNPQFELAEIQTDMKMVCPLPLMSSSPHRPCISPPPLPMVVDLFLVVHLFCRPSLLSSTSSILHV